MTWLVVENYDDSRNPKLRILTGKKHSKTPSAYEKYEYRIWVVGTSNQFFKRGSYTETKISKQWIRTPFFVIIPFCTDILFVLTLASEMAVLCRNIAFSILLLSTKNRYSSFLKKLFVFQKVCFKVKVSKTFKISSNSHRNTCRSLKRRANYKIPSTVF